MEEMEKNESVNNLEVAEQEEVVESTANTNEIGDTEQINKQEDTQENVQENNQPKEEQTHEENAKYASIRRKAEEEANKKIEKVRQEAYELGIQQGKVQSYIGKQNPYTGKTIEDDYDVQEYLDMYELDVKGKDPINDYRELQKQKARKEAEERVKTEEKNKQDKWYQEDTKNFVDKYSVEKLQELSKDEEFNMFAFGKIGKVPLADIYEDYKKFTSKYEQKATETAKKIIANNSATPGAVEEAETQELDWNSMPKEKFEKYVKKAKDGELR